MLEAEEVRFFVANCHTNCLYMHWQKVFDLPRRIVHWQGHGYTTQMKRNVHLAIVQALDHCPSRR